MAYQYPAVVAFSSNGNSVVRNAVFQAYAPSDAGFTTPLAITDTLGNTLSSLNSGAQGVFPAFVQAQYMSVVLSDTPNHQYAWTVPAALSGAVLQWSTNTYYAQGQAVVSPSGDLVTAATAHISGASYNSANWTRNSVNKGDLVFNVKDYGAKGDGTTNDTSALQAAFNAVPTTGGTVYLPPGKYLVTTAVTVPNRTKIVGAGGFDANFNATSSIVCATNAVDALTINADGCTLEDFAVSYTGATRPTSGTGIRFAAGNHARVHRVGVNKFWNCLRFDTGYYYTISDSGIYDPANYGIYLTNTAPGGADHGDQGIVNCVISKVADTTAGGTAVRWESGGGLRFVGNKINAGAQVGYNSTEKWNYGLDIMAADGVSTGIFLIDGNSIENCYQTMLRIGQAGPSNTGDMLGFTITGNEFGVGWGSCDAVTLGAATPAAAGHIRTLNFSGNIIQNIPGRGIVADNITRLGIGPNTFELVTGAQIALGSNHFSTTLDVGAQTVAGSNVTIYSDGIGSGNGGPFQRIQHAYQREINTTTTVQTLWTFNLPSYCAGTFDFVMEGSISGLGAFLIKGSRYFTENSGVPGVTVIGTDITAGYAGTDLVYTVNSSNSQQIVLSVNRASASTGGAVIGRAYVTFNGPLASIVKG